jgi:glucose-1-phosphate cytidylyltransferase
VEAGAEGGAGGTRAARPLLAAADIPVVILAGGQGMRLREETERIPKPMVPIGTKPILWHIMSHYATFGFRRFLVCLGYKGWAIKEYFLNYAEEMSDVRVDLARGNVTLIRDEAVEDWEVTLVDTGIDTGSTGRLIAARRYITTPHLMYTYGDGVGTVDLDAVHRTHLDSGRLVTVTGVRPRSRYGILRHEEDRVTAFTEKPQVGRGYVSGGFFCLDAEVLDRLDPTRPSGFFELDLLPTLVDEGEVGIHRHHGFWHSMDTYRDYVELNELWASGTAPWKTWD